MTNAEHIKTLHPAVQLRAWALIGAMHERGFMVRITHSFRDLALQKKLYEKYKRGEGGMAAKPGWSFHNYRLAFDIIPWHDTDHDRKLDPSELDWNKEKPWWQAAAECAEEVGLNHGASFGDWPHMSFHPNVSIRELALNQIVIHPTFWGSWSTV